MRFRSYKIIGRAIPSGEITEIELTAPHPHGARALAQDQGVIAIKIIRMDSPTITERLRRILPLLLFNVIGAYGVWVVLTRSVTLIAGGRFFSRSAPSTHITGTHAQLIGLAFIVWAVTAGRVDWTISKGNHALSPDALTVGMIVLSLVGLALYVASYLLA